MSKANLFQLGMDLGAGTTHAEETGLERGRVIVFRPDETIEPESGTGVAPEALTDAAREDHFVRRDGRLYAGTHLIVEVVGGKGLDDEARIRTAFLDCIEAAGATLLHIHTHKFSPQGVSGVAVLAESHISVHTWPEIGYGAFDIFMCGEANPWAAIGVLQRAFGAREVRVRELLRGEDVVTDALG
ncbi:MAG: adenosylmethionine decarboxylase [Pseudomonadota bacterium]